MSSIFRTAAFLSLASLLWSAATPQLVAQTSPTPRSTPVVRPLTPKPDLSLLVDATTNFLNGEAFQTESTIEITGSGSASNYQMRFRTNTIVQAPDRFRAEISLIPPSDQADRVDPNRTLVVSDGQRVWIYRADLKQYMSMAYSEFDRRNDSFAPGMSSMLYLIIAPEMKALATQGLLTSETIKNQLDDLATADLKGGNRRVNGEDLFVYEYSDRGNRYSYSAMINPLEKTLRGVQLKGGTPDLSITMTEIIQKRVANPQVIAETFRFTPPRDARQVRSLEIIPF